MNTPDIESLILAIKRKIKKKNLSYRIAAKQAGVAHPTLHHILTGKTRTLTLENYLPLRDWADIADEIANVEALTNGSDNFGIHRELTDTAISLPFFNDLLVRGGKSSDVPDNPPEQLNLYTRLIPRPAKTFILKVSGDSMIGEAIHPDDLLVVEQIESFGEVRNGDIVVTHVAGNLSVKKYVNSGDTIALSSSPPRPDDIRLTPETECKLLGRVLHSIHEH